MSEKQTGWREMEREICRLGHFEEKRHLLLTDSEWNRDESPKKVLGQLIYPLSYAPLPILLIIVFKVIAILDKYCLHTTNILQKYIFLIQYLEPNTRHVLKAS